MERDEVIKSVFRLGRAIKRSQPRENHRHSFAIERLMHVIGRHDGLSSRELCEIMDVRPSSMSEMLSRMEEKNLITRISSESDKRIVKVFLTEEGKEANNQAMERRIKDVENLTSCLSDEEAEQLCNLCNKLSNHLDSLCKDESGECKEHHHRHHGPHHGHHRGPHGDHGPAQGELL